MRKIILFFLIGVTISCSNDAEFSEEISFFNLENGNLWVYQRFNSFDNVNFEATTRIDSVRIVGDTMIAGLNYAIRRHQVNNYPTVDEYIRVNEDGHLVSASGDVINPGIDMDFVDVRDF